MDDDEEGTVVYFQTSPALIGWESQFSSEFSFGEAGTQEVREGPAAPSQNTIRKKLCPCAVALVGSFIPDCSQREIECRRDVAKAIMESPLLTEEDYQLLYFVLLKPHPQEIKPQFPITAPSKRCMVVILVGLMAVCAALFSRVVLMSMTAFGTLLLCVPSVIALLVISRHERLCREVRQGVSDYCRETEGLLSLLSHSLRTIQEAEVVTRRYNNRAFQREGGGGEKDGAVHYQCVGLRYTLFSVCQTVLLRLQSTIVSVQHQYPVSRELDAEATGYLAFTSLNSLHPNITTDLNSEGTHNHKCLSLESLKDAANLLSVLNSELLCHMALAMVTPTDHSGRGDGNSGPRVVPLLNVLPDVLQCVREVVSGEKARLQWSCDFHKNHLFGDPPLRPSPAKAAGETTTSDAVSGLAREVYLLDSKTQSALQRIRDLGSLLHASQNTDVSTEIVKYREQLTDIQRINDDVSDHIEDGLTIIHTLQHPNRENGGMTEEERCDMDSELSERAAEPVVSLAPDLNEDSSTDDEKVFEAYVPALRDSDEASVTDCSWGREDGEARREREMNAKMVRELEGVLAVRSEVRERQREERRRRRRQQRGKTDRGGGSFVAVNEINNSSLLIAAEGGGGMKEHDRDRCNTNIETSRTDSIGREHGKDGVDGETTQTSRETSKRRRNEEITSEPYHERELIMSTVEEKMVATSTEQATENNESTSSELHSSVPPPTSPYSAGPNISDGPTIDQNTQNDESPDTVSDVGLASQLAVTVAAIAAGRRRMNEIETFGSSDESSHSD